MGGVRSTAGAGGVGLGGEGLGADGLGGPDGVAQTGVSNGSEFPPDLFAALEGAVESTTGPSEIDPGVAVERLHQMEIAFGPFERSVRIRIPFERDQVVANLEEGFLSVVLPKTAPRRRRIEPKTE